MIYLDTSAFLKLYVREAESATVADLVTSRFDPLPVWDVLRAEMRNAIHLKKICGDLEAEEAHGLLGLFEDRLARGQYFVPEVDRDRLMTTFVELAQQTPRFGCRTVDIFHVACAVQLDPTCFVSYDSRQRKLADHAGMRVVPETSG